MFWVLKEQYQAGGSFEHLEYMFILMKKKYSRYYTHYFYLSRPMEFLLVSSTYVLVEWLT